MELNKVITGFLINPKKIWTDINSENLESRIISSRFLFPVIVLSAIFKLVGRFVNLKDFSIINSFVSFIAFIFISFAIIYLSSIIINFLLPKFEIKKDLNTVFKLISYSSFPAILANGISDLHPALSFLNLISIYSVILFWIGSGVLLNLKQEKSTGFVLISLIIVSVNLFIISFIVMTIFLSIFFNL